MDVSEKKCGTLCTLCTFYIKFCVYSLNGHAPSIVNNRDTMNNSECSDHIISIDFNTFQPPPYWTPHYSFTAALRLHIRGHSQHNGHVATPTN